MLDFQFEIPPFGVTPDRRMVFQHKQFADAYAVLENAIESGKGFIVITGEVGSGKTTLLRTFLADEHPLLNTAVILNTGLDANGLVKAIAEDLGISITQDSDRKTVIDALNKHLLETFSKGRQTAIFIDEAQNLDTDALEVLRMLSNLETETDKLIQIVLFGQDQLRETLAKPELLQLKSRIAAHRHLKPLDYEETKSYILHRLSAGHPAVPVNFTDSAIKRIYKSSKGIPRIINILSGIALDAAQELDSAEINKEHVLIAENEFKDLEPGALSTASTSKFILTAVSWILVLSLILIIGLKLYNITRQINTDIQIKPQAVQEPVIEFTSETGKILNIFLKKYSIEPHHNSAALESIREDALALSYGKIWTRIHPNLNLIEVIGLPALLYVGNAQAKNLAVVSRTDSPGWFSIDRPAGSITLPANLIAVDTTQSASILLPTDEIHLPFMYVGYSGTEAANLQKSLNEQGYYDSEINGVYDIKTYEAVIKFQMDNGLEVDGLAGPHTIGALVSKRSIKNE